MISTDEEFEKEASLFFLKIAKNLNLDYAFNIESEALDYVKNNLRFKYKDHVEAGVLIRILEKYGYINFDQREGNSRYHRLTQKGLEFLNSK